MNTRTFFLSNNTLYTSNYGFDCKENPFIPLNEYIEDICLVDKEQFLKFLKDIQEELKYLPFHMKSVGISVLVDWRKNYDKYREKHLKNVKNFPMRETNPFLFDFIFKTSCKDLSITKDTIKMKG